MNSGTYIPIPGINPDVFAQSFESQSSGILGMFNLLSGGAVERMAIFALSIMPYASAIVIVRLMTSSLWTLQAPNGEGEQGMKQMIFHGPPAESDQRRGTRQVGPQPRRTCSRI